MCLSISFSFFLRKEKACHSLTGYVITVKFMLFCNLETRLEFSKEGECLALCVPVGLAQCHMPSGTQITTAG